MYFTNSKIFDGLIDTPNAGPNSSQVAKISAKKSQRDKGQQGVSCLCLSTDDDIYISFLQIDFHCHRCGEGTKLQADAVLRRK